MARHQGRYRRRLTLPELPEVEVVRRGIDKHVVGRIIRTATVFDARSLRRHLAGPADFVDALAGRSVTGVARRGKYLWLQLDDDAVICHLGMSGQVLVEHPDAPLEKHVKVVLDLSDGMQMRFVDPRIFGGMFFSPGGAVLPAEVAHIARDPLDPLFNAEEFRFRLTRRSTGIKRALLDQGLISGVGNIYADESLWRSKLHYARDSHNLRAPEVTRLLTNVVEVMTEALGQGGTSFDAMYVNVNGQGGYFERSLNVYGQQGKPCPRCGTSIVRESFMNRGSHFCPKCQRIR